MLLAAATMSVKLSITVNYSQPAVSLSRAVYASSYFSTIEGNLKTEAN